MHIIYTIHYPDEVVPSQKLQILIKKSDPNEVIKQKEAS